MARASIYRIHMVEKGKGLKVRAEQVSKRLDGSDPRAEVADWWLVWPIG